MAGQRLLERLPHLLSDLQDVRPCLLHGDLWSGNVTTDKNGAPVILDPACYCMLTCMHQPFIPLLLQLKEQIAT